jgi:hypothetical protein
MDQICQVYAIYFMMYQMKHVWYLDSRALLCWKFQVDHTTSSKNFGILNVDSIWFAATLYSVGNKRPGRDGMGQPAKIPNRAVPWQNFELVRIVHLSQDN